jgi:hypothetical protein
LGSEQTGEVPRSSHNDRVLRRLEDTAASFLSGEVEVEELQWLIESASDLLERDGRETRDALRRAGADIELARFTLPLEEQHAAVSRRVRVLLEELSPGES